MKNKSIALLLIFLIASSDLFIASNALHLQRNHAQFGLHLEQTGADVTKAAAVVKEIKGVVEAFASDKDASVVASALKSLGKLGTSLGALGAVLTVVDLLFSPTQQSDVDIITDRIEVTEIKILNAIGDAAATANIQSRKQQLASAETKINSAAGYLQKMRQCQSNPKSQANTNAFNANKKQFEKDAKDTDDYIEQICDTFNTTFANGEPLPIAISRVSAGNWNIVKAAVEKLTLLLIQAQINYSAYLTLNDKKSLPTFQKDFTERLNAVAAFIEALPKKNFDIASTSIISGLTDTVKTTCNNENSDSQISACATLLAKSYKNKYPNLKFDIFVYKDLSRSQKNGHAFAGQNCAWTQTQSKNVLLCYVSDAKCVKKTSSAKIDANSLILAGSDSLSCEKMMSSDARIKQQFFYIDNSAHMKFVNDYEPSSKGNQALSIVKIPFVGFVYEEAKPAGVSCFWTDASLKI